MKISGATSQPQAFPIIINSQFAIRNSQLFLLLLLLPCWLSAQSVSAQFTIYGRVSLPDGTPAGRAIVKVRSNSGMERQTWTDDAGHYEVPNVSRGKYQVTAENRADPEQFSDPVDAETGRIVGYRIQANVYLRYRNKVVESGANKLQTVTLAEQLQSVPKPAQKSFEQALKWRNEKQFDKALQSFDRSIEQYPQFFQAMAERGHTRIALGKPVEAAADFAKALAINAGYGPALRGSGMCKFQQGKFAEAVQDLEKALDAEPRNANTSLFLGVANLALDRKEQARAALLRALALDPEGAARAHVHLANLSIKENKYPEAVSEIEAYLLVAPTAPDAERLRSIAAQLKTKTN
jgi:tetratricopeptide (TPR) repeat protein